MFPSTPTTAASAAVGLLAAGATALLLACAYLGGYWNVFGVEWQSAVTLERLTSLPWKITAGFVGVATAFAFLAQRLKGYALGRDMNKLGLVAFALSILGAMYVATYDQLTLMDAYPFVGLLAISLLLFRFESRVVAAVLVGVIMLSFYAMGAKELGERDAERALLNENNKTASLMVE